VNTPRLSMQCKSLNFNIAAAWAERGKMRLAWLMLCVTTYQAFLHTCNAWTGFIAAVRS